MDDRIIQFRVGVLVVATCIITAILVVLFGELPRLASQQYTITVRFEQAPGVTVDTPVRKSGILIGRVSDVELRPVGGVDVTLRIDGKQRLRQDELCRISTGNVLLGDAALEFVPSGDPTDTTETLSKGALIQGEVATGPLDVMNVFVDVAQMIKDLEDDITTASRSIKLAGEEVATVSRNMNTVVENNQTQFLRIMQKSERTIDNFDITLTAVNELVGDQELRAAFRRSLSEVPELMADSREAMNAIQSMAERADENFANLEGLTGPLGEQGEELVNSIDTSIGRLDDMLIQFTEFGRALNSPDGSLGQFVHNPDLYQRLNRAAENFEELSQRFRPIVEDARVFTDKIARNPGSLTSGVLRPRQSGVKFKTF